MKQLLKYIVLLTFLTFLSCGSDKNQTSETTEEKTELPSSITLSEGQIKSIGITTTSVESKAIEKTIRLNGKVTVAPSHLVSVSSILGGRVKSIKVLPGSSFRKGAILAMLEDEKFVQLQQDYLIAKAQSESARLDYERQKELNLNKTSSDKIFQTAEANYKTLDATRKGLEEKLRLIHINPNQLTSGNISSSVAIIAPFDGVVSKILSNTGQYLNPSDILMELIDNTGLLINLKAFESDMLSLETGQAILVYTNQNPDKKLEAKIISIVPNIENDGSSDVIAKLDKTSSEFVSGLYVSSDVILKNFETSVLPEQSVVSFENSNYVFQDSGNNIFQLLSVQTGTSSNGFVEIQNADQLKNKKIVQKGAYDLLMALKNEVE